VAGGWRSSGAPGVACAWDGKKLKNKQRGYDATSAEAVGGFSPPDNSRLPRHMPRLLVQVLVWWPGAPEVALVSIHCF
jgi:hypothetical protein